MKDYLGEGLVADTLPQHDPAIQRYLGCLVPSHRNRVFASPLREPPDCVQYVQHGVFVSPFQQYKEDLLVGTEVFDSGAPRPNLPPQDVVKDLTHILLPLETNTN